MNKKAVIEKSTEIIIMILLGVILIMLYMFGVLSPTKIKEMLSNSFDAIEKMVFGG